MEKKPINEITTERGLHFKPYGWHHWPEHPWMSYQFRRALGETQKGDGAISECFPAAFRMVPGDKESWHVEWLRLAERNHRRSGGPYRDRPELLAARGRLLPSG